MNNKNTIGASSINSARNTLRSRLFSDAGVQEEGNIDEDISICKKQIKKYSDLNKLIALASGLFYLINFPLFDFVKNRLKLTVSQYAFYQAFATSPFILKLFISWYLDSFHPFGYK